MRWCSRWDEQPHQKAVQENAQLPGRRDPPRDGVDALLQRGPDEADRQPEGRSKGRDAQKCPSQPGIHLRDQPFELLFITVVENVRRRKAQQDTARHAGVHHLNAEDGGLARGGKARSGRRAGQGRPQRIQRGVVGREEDEISHEGEQRGLLLFGAGAQGGDAHAQNGAEVVDGGPSSRCTAPRPPAGWGASSAPGRAGAAGLLVSSAPTTNSSPAAVR